MTTSLRTGENFDFNELFSSRTMALSERVALVSAIVGQHEANETSPYHRVIDSPMGRSVKLMSSKGHALDILMFGSNNYLGFANHPHLAAKINEAVARWGSGHSGPPHLNGYTSIARDLEARLAEFKGKEDAMLFSSGFSANLAVAASLAQPRDVFFYDENSHASMFDGIRLSGARSRRFPHNDVNALADLLERHQPDETRDVYVTVEGVYSMEGDIAPLDEITALVKKHKAILLLDDAHGTGVMGTSGHGTGHHFGVSEDIEFIVGTFSKTFAVTGGFVAASREQINYLRYAARSYMFSAGLPPASVAAVHAGLDLLQSEPQHLQKLRSNIAYAQERFNALPYSFSLDLQSPIISLKAVPTMNVRMETRRLQELGVFVNPVEFPAVSQEDERFRISLSASHSSEDIDHLVAAVDNIWSTHLGRGSVG